jgi:hypothetical protein
MTRPPAHAAPRSRGPAVLLALFLAAHAAWIVLDFLVDGQGFAYFRLDDLARTLLALSGPFDGLLVGGVWLPFPIWFTHVLLRLFPTDHLLLVPVAANAVLSSAALAGLYALSLRLAPGRTVLALVPVALAASTRPFAELSASAGSEPLYHCLWLAVLWFLLDYAERRRPADFVLGALALAAACLTRYEAWFLCFALAALALREVHRRSRPGHAALYWALAAGAVALAFAPTNWNTSVCRPLGRGAWQLVYVAFLFSPVSMLLGLAGLATARTGARRLYAYAVGATAVQLLLLHVVFLPAALFERVVLNLTILLPPLAVPLLGRWADALRRVRVGPAVGAAALLAVPVAASMRRSPYPPMPGREWQYAAWALTEPWAARIAPTAEIFFQRDRQSRGVETPPTFLWRVITRDRVLGTRSFQSARNLAGSPLTPRELADFRLLLMPERDPAFKPPPAFVPIGRVARHLVWANRDRRDSYALFRQVFRGASPLFR